MSFPRDVSVIDLMLSIPGEDPSAWYAFMKPLFRDEESRAHFEMPAQYMFRDIPRVEAREDYITYTLEEMDRYNIGRAMVGIGGPNSPKQITFVLGGLLICINGYTTYAA